MLSTVLVLGYGPALEYSVTTTPGPHGLIGAVDIGDTGLRIQSSDPAALLDLAEAIANAAERLNLQPVKL